MSADLVVDATGRGSRTPVWLEQFVEPGTHLVGHSYGGVISLLAAAKEPELFRSLTVIEPPAFGVARGKPEVDEFIERIEAHWGSETDPAAFLAGFLGLVGSNIPPGDFNAELLQGARTLMVERSPAEAVIPFDALGRAEFPKLVVSGAHHPAFEAVCDVLSEGIGARREDASPSLVPKPTVSLVDTYLDTPDWRLHRAGFSLRLRQNDGEARAFD